MSLQNIVDNSTGNAMKHNVRSSKCAPIHLIPTVGIERLAERFQAGVDRKGDGAWNACSLNQAVLEDVDFGIERISHVIKHALLLRDKLLAYKGGGEFDFSDDDAGAIAWGGVFLICLTCQLEKDTAVRPDTSNGANSSPP